VVDGKLRSVPAPDPLRYVVWVCRRPDLFPGELHPRIAYHITQVGGPGG